MTIEDGPQAAGFAGSRGARGRAVDLDIALSIDQAAAGLATDPLQGIAGQALVGTALEHITPQVGVAGDALGLLDFAGSGGQFVPGLRYRLAVFFSAD